MMNKTTAAQGFGVALATPLAIGTAAVAYKAQLHIFLIPMIFIVVWVGLFKTVVWTLCANSRLPARNTADEIRTFTIGYVPKDAANSKQPTTKTRVADQFEFLTASSSVDGVILSVAVLQAQRRISSYGSACKG